MLRHVPRAVGQLRAAVLGIVAPLTVVLAGVAVLVLDGHGVSWLAGLVAGGGAGATTTLRWGRRRRRSAGDAVRVERRTAAALAPLQSAGWRVLHDVPGPDGTYDHIAVGPGGLILLESLGPDGVVTMSHGEPVVEYRDGTASAPRRERLRPRALADATAVRDSVQRIARRRLWVQAVVVLWSDFPAGCVADGRCVYIHGSRLASWLARRPHQLDEAEAAEVFAAAERLAGHGGAPGLPVAV